MSSLTPLQLKQIEENRLAALKRRQEKQKALSPAKQPCQVLSSNSNVSNNTNNFIGANSTSQYVINKAPDNVVTVAKPSFYNSNSSSLSSSNSLTKNGYLSSTNYDIKSNNKSTTHQQEHQIDIKKTLLSTYVTGTCRLISTDRFTIDVPFHQQLIDYFKTVPNKMYDAKERKWNFPLSQYNDIMNKLNQFKPEVTVNPLPNFLIKALLSNNTSSVPYTSIDISCISPQLRNQLYPFQVEGIQFAISKKGRCLIADEMGLGKTIQALGVADYYKSNWPLLIVCPSSMRYQWEEEVRKYIPDVPLHQIFVMKNSKDYIDKEVVKVLIVSYDLLGKNSDFFKSLKFGISILDESHSLKSSKTRRTRAALEVLKKVTRVILLSGTPAVSRPIELYNQIVAIETSRFATVKEYGLRYCDGKESKFGWDFTGSSNMDELKILLESKYMIRRLKTNVLSQLPSKIRQVVVLNSDDIKAESQAMKAYSNNLSRTNLKGMERRGQLLLYFAETGKVKLKAVCDYIMKLLEEGKKFLCFAHHQNVLDGICETLHKCKTEYIRIDGKVGTEDRKKFCDKFQFEEKYRVAVLSLKAANVGLTLTSAQLVVFAELFWNPGDLTQAEDRVHRIGQQDSVLVQYLLAKKTADDYLWPLVQDKLDVLGKAGLTKDTFVNSGIKSLTNKTDHKQQEITDFFTKDDLDEENLSKLMDEIDGGVVEKKIKLM